MRRRADRSFEGGYSAPRWVPMLGHMGDAWAGAGLGALVARAGLLPLVLRGRWSARRAPEAIPELDDFPFVDRMRAALSSGLDDLFLLSELIVGDYALEEGLAHSRAEVEGALECAAGEGWLETPTAFHQAPTPPGPGLRLQGIEGRAGEFELQFESGFQPSRALPGSRRYLCALPNHTAAARLLIHPGQERPWVVCLPGFRMGHPAVDAFGFRTTWLHRTLGLNVAVLTMPFHGSRRCGARSGDGFVSGDVVGTLLAETQAVWDARRLIAWLRTRGAPGIAVLGLSLGGYTTGLVAALEPDLDCAIAGIPVVDLFDLVDRHAGGAIAEVADRFGVCWESVRALGRLISPLAMPAALPPERCFVFAGLSDGLAPPAHARALWTHWGRPRIEWYPGGHVAFVVEPRVQGLIGEALDQTGLLAVATGTMRQAG